MGKGDKMSKYKKVIISIILLTVVLSTIMTIQETKAVSLKMVNSAYNNFLSKKINYGQVWKHIQQMQILNSELKI